MDRAEKAVGLFKSGCDRAPKENGAVPAERTAELYKKQ